jgi:predicted unusual protein kinase regulating ubiquinone biosynthesis (AarF/ABC1/UbiB family)
VVKRQNKKKKELTSIATSTAARSSKLVMLSLRASADAAFLKIRTLIDSSQKADLTRNFLIDQANRLTDELGALKGSLQKAGQLFSIYGEHFLPSEVRDILKSLQKESPPVKTEIMMSAARRSLGTERFRNLQIEANPIGAASIGQVYRVQELGDPRKWCMKVQYPGVDESIDSDLRNLKRIFTVLRFIPKDINLDGLFAEIRMMLHREVDYLKEADATDYFRSALKKDTRFVVPEVNRTYLTKRVILTSFQEGYDVDSPEVLALPQARRNRLGMAILDLFFMEFFKFHVVQTDPHFGNYRVKINAEQDQWVLLDFGAIREFPKSFIKAYHAISNAVVVHRDSERLFQALKPLKIMTDDDTESDIKAFYEISELISEPFLTYTEYRWGRTQLAQRAAEKVKDVLRKHGIRRPPQELVFLDRKIGGVFTILQKLDAEFAPRPLLDAYLKP